MLHAFAKCEKRLRNILLKFKPTFYWVFMPLFRELNTLTGFVDFHNFDKVVVHGELLHNYSAFINRVMNPDHFYIFQNFYTLNGWFQFYKKAER